MTTETTTTLRERAIEAARQAREQAERERREREERERQKRRDEWTKLAIIVRRCNDAWIGRALVEFDADAELVIIDGLPFHVIELRCNGPSLVLADRCSICGAILPHPNGSPYDPVRSLTELGFRLDEYAANPYECEACLAKRFDQVVE